MSGKDKNGKKREIEETPSSDSGEPTPTQDLPPRVPANVYNALFGGEDFLAGLAFMQRVTEKQISQVIEFTFEQARMAERHDERVAKDLQSRRWFALASLILILSVSLAVLVFLVLTGHEDLLVQLITIVTALLGGGGLVTIFGPRLRP